MSDKIPVLYVNYLPRAYDPEAVSRALEKREIPPKAVSVIVDSMVEVAKLFNGHPLPKPQKVVVNSPDIVRFADGNKGRYSWLAATLENNLSDEYHVEFVNFGWVSPARRASMPFGDHFRECVHHTFGLDLAVLKVEPKATPALASQNTNSA